MGGVCSVFEGPCAVSAFIVPHGRQFHWLFVRLYLILLGKIREVAHYEMHVTTTTSTLLLISYRVRRTDCSCLSACSCEW